MTNNKGFTENWILRSLPADQRERLGPHLLGVNLKFGEVLYEPGDSIRNVYFPNSGLVSLLSMDEEGRRIEVAMAGVEGMVGTVGALGCSEIPYQAMVQGEGTAFTLEADILKREIDRGGQLRESVDRYTGALLAEISQSASCAIFHSIRQRLSRWLLTAQDRARLDRFQLTQEFLSEMLGCRRQGISEAIAALLETSVILYDRCCVTIVDRRGLESSACGCYWSASASHRDYIKASFQKSLYEVSAAGRTSR